MKLLYGTAALVALLGKPCIMQGNGLHLQCD